MKILHNVALGVLLVSCITFGMDSHREALITNKSRKVAVVYCDILLPDTRPSVQGILLRPNEQRKMPLSAVAITARIGGRRTTHRVDNSRLYTINQMKSGRVKIIRG